MAHERSSTASPSPIKKPRTGNELVETGLSSAAGPAESSTTSPALAEAHTADPSTAPVVTTGDPAGETYIIPEDSSMHQPVPRVIDETTDMTTLTDQEIMQLMEGMGEEDVTSKVGQISILIASNSS